VQLANLVAVATEKFGDDRFDRGSWHLATVGEMPRRPAQPLRGRVDFVLARRQIEDQTQFTRVTRARALAAYVGLFELADDDGSVEASSEEIAEEFEISRVSWLAYRVVLESAGLLEMDPQVGANRRTFRLRAP
jgi:hypothetical protein